MCKETKDIYIMFLSAIFLPPTHVSLKSILSKNIKKIYKEMNTYLLYYAGSLHFTAVMKHGKIECTGEDLVEAVLVRSDLRAPRWWIMADGCSGMERSFGVGTVAIPRRDGG